MYLKSLEMIGFKSFVDKTKLDFEPGMTAIVGPNGCGKSNISDGIRWVLGEQSAKALRGSKMEDCIFNGTDHRKPLQMAEVSITLADCEQALKTEYNEVTVTRRVLRSGEGQYFINRTPCRLKDIQRLFMDTGIGTRSYSFMEQGRIDQILSSRPEDRREVFEEASGITKYKTDRDEAMRKLDYTENNLLRLSDVIREVKRQIGSLQRQAGKARTFKTLKDELRKLDIYTTRRRVSAMDSNIASLEAEVRQTAAKLQAAQAEVEEMDHGSAVQRNNLMQTEREIASHIEAGSEAQNQLVRARELIEVDRQRIAEYKALSERDSREITQNKAQIAEKRRILAKLEAEHGTYLAAQEKARKELEASEENFASYQKRMDDARLRVQGLREESFSLDKMVSDLQNQRTEIEARERAAVIQRERLAAEKAQLGRHASSLDKRREEMSLEVGVLKTDVELCEKTVADIESRKLAGTADIAGLREQCGELQSQIAGKKAQIEFLNEATRSGEDMPDGAKMLLDNPADLGVEKSRILGALASHIEAEPGYETALEAALRNWLDAIVVTDLADALQIVRRIESKQGGSIRLIPADIAPRAQQPTTLKGERLLNRVKCSDVAGPIMQQLIGDMRVLESIDDLPQPIPAGVSYVTKGGALVHGDGCAEFWSAEAAATNPLARRHAAAEAGRELAAIESEREKRVTALHTLTAEIERLDSALNIARTEANRVTRLMAQKEGEFQLISKDSAEAGERLSVASFELESLTSQERKGDQARETISRRIEEVRLQREKVNTDAGTLSRELSQLESRHSEVQGELSSHKIRFSELTQKVGHVELQERDLSDRVSELEAITDSRTQGVISYDSSIAKFSEEIAATESRLSSLESAVSVNHQKVEALRKHRDKQQQEVEAMEVALTRGRAELEEIRTTKGNLDVRFTEVRMKRQNMVERVTQDYAATFEQILAEPEPEWDGDAPALDVAETRVAELKTKLDAMGPVNLVAIDEYKELEDRYAFLTEQEKDLTNSKQQLIDLIKKINKTSTEMFKNTFDRVNENFQMMFSRMFNGGSAKLVLVNEEDVLECGIEIIARPPGKRLQNVSLLSGGERTLTAVALMFSIYMIKPSPFCMLDELDAPLDEANIGRFVGVLQDFLKQSQFVVITHNRQTISAGDVLYGVTMAEKGISSIVSVKFKDGVERPIPKQPAPPALPTIEPDPVAEAPVESTEKAATSDEQAPSNSQEELPAEPEMASKT